jgi:hypothetical protein
MKIQEYVDKVTRRYRSGIATEKYYRRDLKILLESYAPDFVIASGPAITTCNSPDYIITSRNIPVGYITTLNIDKQLENPGINKESDLIKKSLANLILTNYFEFHLYQDGMFKSLVLSAEILDGKMISKPGNLLSAEALLKEFLSYQRSFIGTSLKLSQKMANTAQLLACVIENVIIQDEQESKNQKYKPSKITLKEQLANIGTVLKNDISAKDLADIYAQTISYGMFAARIYGGPALEEFTRQKAAELIPLSYHLLKKLFQYLAGNDLDDRITWIIDDLTDLFRSTDIAVLIDHFKNFAAQDNPITHFHESFLENYNPKLRIGRNEVNKPEPIVAFIAEAVNKCRS